MLEIKVTVVIPGMPEAINNLAQALTNSSVPAHPRTVQNISIETTQAAPKVVAEQPVVVPQTNTEITHEPIAPESTPAVQTTPIAPAPTPAPAPGASGDTELFEKASNINGFQGGRVANNLYISPFRTTVFKTAALFLYLNSSVVIRVRKPLFFPL